MKNRAYTFVLFAMTAAIAGCASRESSSVLSPPTELSPAPVRTEAAFNPEVNSYIGSLKYNPQLILTEQADEGDTISKQLPETTSDDGKAFIVCRQAEHKLSKNIEDITILNPIQGVVWPGALVKVDGELIRGTPTPIQCNRAPVWLSVDLPGIGGRGVFEVSNPSQGTVQAAVDAALHYWNEHQYREGYVSKARSKYEATFVYSAKQLAAALGISYRSLNAGLAAQFQAASSSESSVGMVLFRQVFYTVSFDPPAHPGGVFASDATLEEVRNACSNDEPPAYVSSVDYGRILMLRIETSTDTLHTQMDAAMRYMSVKGRISAEFQSTLSKSKVTLITIGGNAEVNARAVDATRIEDLNKVIEGKNALYSKNNPGQPVAYTVRFLKDGRLARMGFATDYTEIICERHTHGWVGIKNSGGFYAKLMVGWKENNQPKYWSSGSVASGKSAKIPMKGNATDINIKAQCQTGFGWRDILTKQASAPPCKYYVVSGTTFNTSWKEADE